MRKTKTGCIKFDRNNYRTHDESNKRMIRESLEACGAGRSVLVDNQNELIAGNGVFEQAQKLGIPTRIIETDGTELVVVKRTDLEPEDKKRKQLAAADNAISDKVTWDAPAIRADFTMEEIQALNIDLPPVELNETPPPVEAKEDTFDEDTDTVPTRVKRGDVWQLGKHRVMCGDSTSADDVAKLMNGQTADMVFTDPPYGVSATGCRQQTKKRLGIKAITNDEKRGNSLEEFLGGFIKQLQCKDGASIYICYPWATQAEFTNAIRNCGLQIKNCIIWDKKVFGLNRNKGYRPQYEMIYFCCKGDFIWYGDKAQSNIWQVAREINRKEQGNHPTPKPVALVGRAINNSSKRGDIVVDMFCGSGATLIAAEQLGRTCFAMELDAHYCDVILARWEKLTDQKAVKL